MYIDAQSTIFRLVRCWKHVGMMTRWWKHEGTMMKTRRYDDEKRVGTMTRWWKHEGTMMKNALVRWHDDETTKVRWWKRVGTYNKIKNYDCLNETSCTSDIRHILFKPFEQYFIVIFLVLKKKGISFCFSFWWVDIAVLCSC